MFLSCFWIPLHWSEYEVQLWKDCFDNCLRLWTQWYCQIAFDHSECELCIWEDCLNQIQCKCCDKVFRPFFSLNSHKNQVKVMFHVWKINASMWSLWQLYFYRIWTLYPRWLHECDHCDNYFSILCLSDFYPSNLNIFSIKYLNEWNPLLSFLLNATNSKVSCREYRYCISLESFNILVHNRYILWILL